MSKKSESTKTETKKLNKLAVKKETISDLNVKDSDQVKGGASYVWKGTCGPICEKVSAPPACIKA